MLCVSPALVLGALLVSPANGLIVQPARPIHRGNIGIYRRAAVPTQQVAPSPSLRAVRCARPASLRSVSSKCSIASLDGPLGFASWGLIFAYQAYAKRFTAAWSSQNAEARAVWARYILEKGDYIRCPDAAQCTHGEYYAIASSALAPSFTHNGAAPLPWPSGACRFGTYHAGRPLQEGKTNSLFATHSLCAGAHLARAETREATDCDTPRHRPCDGPSSAIRPWPFCTLPPPPSRLTRALAYPVYLCSSAAVVSRPLSLLPRVLQHSRWWSVLHPRQRRRSRGSH